MGLPAGCASEGHPLATEQAGRCGLPWRYANTLRAMSPRQRGMLEPLTPLRLEFPANAAERAIEGCALVSFTVNAAGTPQHVRIAAEFPRGLGFGAALAAAVSRARYPGPDARVHFQHTDFLFATR